MPRQHVAHLLATYCVPAKHTHLALSRPPSGAWEGAAREAQESVLRTWKAATHFTPPSTFTERFWLDEQSGGMAMQSPLKTCKCGFWVPFQKVIAELQDRMPTVWVTWILPELMAPNMDQFMIPHDASVVEQPRGGEALGRRCALFPTVTTRSY